jgi:hypothetical protein
MAELSDRLMIQHVSALKQHFTASGTLQQNQEATV